jgi:hypothetical protein
MIERIDYTAMQGADYAGLASDVSGRAGIASRVRIFNAHAVTDAEAVSGL